MNKKSSSTIDRSYIKGEEFKIKYDTISNSLFHHKKVVKTSVGKRLQPSNEKNNNKITLEINLIPRLLKQNPTMITEVLNHIS